MPIKDKIKNREYQREYQRKWRERNPDKFKEIQKKCYSTPERKEYLRNWFAKSPKAKIIKERFKENNPDKQKVYSHKYNISDKAISKNRKYYYSIKGTVNFLKKKDKIKFGENSNINIELIEFVNQRDKVCRYCGKDFIPRKEYDHINPFKPLSKDNVALVCGKCNQSKNNADLISWLKFKGYEITKEIQELYKIAYK